MDLISDDILTTHLLPRLNLAARVRLAAVSKRWRSLSRLAPFPAGAKMPWILSFFGREKGPSLLYIENGLPTPTTHLPRPPEISNPFSLVGAVDGWGILVKFEPCRSAVSLYDPFSGETRLIIPQLTDWDGCRNIAINCARFSPDFELIAGTDCTNRLFVSRLSHSRWVDMSLNPVSDFIFYNGELYCILNGGSVYKYSIQQLFENLKGARPKIVCRLSEDLHSNLQLPTHSIIVYYLVESAGELLVVSRRSFTLWDEGFIVHRVDFNQQPTLVSSDVGYVSLVPVIDLGDEMLFVEKARSMSLPGIANEQSSFFVKNNIYFFGVRHMRSCYHFGKFPMEGIETGLNLPVFNQQEVKSSVPPIWITTRLNSISSCEALTYI